MMGLALAVIPYLAAAEPDPIEASGQTATVWSLAVAVVGVIGTVVVTLIRSRIGNEVVREDKPDAAEHAKILNDIATRMTERLEARVVELEAKVDSEILARRTAEDKVDRLEREVDDERQLRRTETAVWRAFAHSVQVWTSQAQAAAERAGITLPPPPDSPMQEQ